MGSGVGVPGTVYAMNPVRVPAPAVIVSAATHRVATSKDLMSALACLAICSSLAVAQGAERDVWLRDFRFASGEHLDSLRMHVTTLGQPRRDSRGNIRNAILILHGTTGSGRAFQFGNGGRPTAVPVGFVERLGEDVPFPVGDPF